MFEVPLYCIARGGQPAACGCASQVGLGHLRLYRGTSLVRKRSPLGPYCRPMPRDLWWSCGGVLFLMREVPLYSRWRERTVHFATRPYTIITRHYTRNPWTLQPKYIPPTL